MDAHEQEPDTRHEPRRARAPDGAGLAAVAASGSTWSTAQATASKAATACSMLIVAGFLSPAQMGVATLAIAASGFLVPFPPLVMGDVLIGMGLADERSRRAGARIAMVHALAMAALAVGLAWPIACAYGDAPTMTLALLIGLLGAKPIADALSVLSLTRLRLAFAYRAIAVADGVTQLAATVATAAMAVAGAGPFAIVVPQSTGIFAKAAWYRRAAGREELAGGGMPPEPGTGEIARSFRTAAVGQYVHNLAFAIAPLLLGLLAASEETGLYAFAFMLATQATVIVSSQLVVVLQPVLSRLNGDPGRQSEAYLRIITVLCAVAVPVSLLQAAFAGPLFDLLFRPKWDGAFLPFAVLSVAQCFYVIVSPTIALMKARARFRTFLRWQCAHLVGASIAYAAGARFGGALGVAVADLAVWAVSVTAAMLLSTGGSAVSPRRCARAVLLPAATAIPIAAACMAAASWLSSYGKFGTAAALLVVGPIAAIAAAVAVRRTQPDAWADLRQIGARFPARLLRRRRGTASAGT
jgi:O-antigen/teichoic acid export membrane protein